MPKFTENYLSTPPTFEELDKIIGDAGLWEPMCVKNRETPIRSGKKGAFAGIPDSNQGMPILRCPSFFETKLLPKELQTMFPDIDFNIVKAQKYIRGIEGITPHSDKCIDIEKGTSIWIYRINKDNGYRSLYFSDSKALRPGNSTIQEIGRTDKTGVQQFKMKSNSLVETTYEENQHMLHWVPKEDAKDVAEECISLVLRKSHTFRLPSGAIYGKAAKYKTYKERIKSCETPINIRDDYSDIIKMYGIENYTDIRDEKCSEYEEILQTIIGKTV